MDNQELLDAVDTNAAVIKQRMAIMENLIRAQERRKEEIRRERLQLAKENDVLKSEIGGLVKKLNVLEMKNGKKRVNIQPPKPAVTQLHVQKTADLPTANANIVALEANAEQKPGNDGKAKKEKPKKTGASAPTGGDDTRIDVSRLDLRVGRIISAEKHPDADSLYVEQVDVGEGKNRTVVSGLVKFIPIEQMQNRMALLMCNLKPAKMRGVLSEAMVMCASTPEKVEILEVPEGAVPGDRIVVDGYPGECDAQLNPKKKVWEQVAPDLKTNDEGVATYKGASLTVPGKGVVKAQTLTNVQVK
jgi:aminoacyl tRNA synthase complex-interacting multifunctional protein 1